MLLDIVKGMDFEVLKVVLIECLIVVVKVVIGLVSCVWCVIILIIEFSFVKGEVMEKGLLN